MSTHRVFLHVSVFEAMRAHSLSVTPPHSLSPKVNFLKGALIFPLLAYVLGTNFFLNVCISYLR